MEEKETTLGITVKKSDDFSEWYTQVIQKSELADYSSVSGCIVFRPLSFAIWEKIKEEVDKRIKAMGVKNAYFPLLIPEKTLQKEAEHLKGFTPEVAWVTEAGNSKLDERLAIRPTSETIMYEAYSRWIQSWRDLPLKINQWNSVIRWEFRHSIPFLRTREFLWNEGHTVFATKEEAEKEVKEIMDMYGVILKDFMALPSLQGKKTQAETFAGAEYTLSHELYLPNGKAIQGPDAHHDGQKFAKAYNITFLNKKKETEYAWQNTWAITTRMLGVMFAIHSDDKGLVLPPKLSENKAVVVPILFKGKEEGVLKAAKEVGEMLKGYDAVVDDRDIYTAGWKFNHWERKGVPLRIEVGPRDVENKQVVVVIRDTGEKLNVQLDELKEKVQKLLEEMHKRLYDKAKKLLDDNIIEAKDKDSLMKGIKDSKIVVAPWCEGCMEEFKHETGGAKPLNMPFEQDFKGKKCAFCGAEAKAVVRFGKSY